MHALVTGASSGIGAAVVDRLLAEGWSVTGLSRTEPPARDGLTWLPADLTDLDVNAYFIHANIGRTFQGAWSPRLVLSYDRASGDGPGKRYKRYDTLFGARVFEFGPSSLYGPIGRANLNSPEMRLEVKPDKSWDGHVAVRGLWLENATDTFSSTGLRDASGRTGRSAGTQIEVRARHWLIPDRVRVSGGGAVLAKGDFLRNAPRAPDNGDTHYGFMEVTYSF